MISSAKPSVFRYLSPYLWFVVPFSMLCAVIVTYLIRVGDSLVGNFVFSLCICAIGTALVEGGSFLLWRDSKPPRLSFIILVLVSIPFAYVFGTLAAILILGLPPTNVFSHQSQHAAPLLILSALATGFAVWLFSSRARVAELSAAAATEKARAAAIEKQALQAQLQLLQSQIEPHMLFNTLANLQGLIATDAPRAQQMLDQLIHYLRATLISSRIEKTTLAQEFALMAAYLELMTVRMGSRLSYAMQLPPELSSVTLPPMLLQPLVENAIRHGIEPAIEGGRIEISAMEERGLLTLIVRDSGSGLNPSAPEPSGTHIGLANVRERLHALFGANASLSLRSNTPTGVIACITIPL